MVNNIKFVQLKVPTLDKEMWKYNSNDVIKVLLNHVWEGLTLLLHTSPQSRFD